METDRSHRSNSSNNSSSSSTSELFICFTSRLSSSSMKIPSKSIFSPGRSREPSHISLSNSLSRRLRTNGSMKGGQTSPMFPTNGKKRGCSFENPEPSSPKVTCIGQVRVKTKKRSKKLRTRSQRRSGEVSFRRVEQSNLEDLSHTHVENQFLNHHQQSHRNQKWVHLPLTICETLRAFGADFNCFLPCRSSCMASEKEKEEKAATGSSNGGGSSCGAVFARWLVAVQEGDEKGRQIELVVGEEEEGEEESGERRSSYRRHVFEEIDFKEEEFKRGNEDLQEEEARVSICIPPKNALLLMRCRSDPVKMAALANKFWEPPLPNDNDEEEQDGEEETQVNNGNEEEAKIEILQVEAGDEEEQTQIEQEMEDLIKEKLVSCDSSVEEHQMQETQAVMEEGSSLQISRDIGGEQEQEAETKITQQEFPLGGPSPQKETEDLEKLKNQENEDNTQQESEDTREHLPTTLPDDEVETPELHVVSVRQEQERERERTGQELVGKESKSEAEQELGIQESKEQKATTENRCSHEEDEEEESEPGPEENPMIQEGQTNVKSKERESQPLLPDCLLLMMCEPKLSMEVSKETWVCSTDFIRRLPEHSRPVKKRDGGDQPKKRTSIEINPPPLQSNLQQPPRSSCSYPAKPPARAAGAESMSTAIEKKLVGTKAYAPFVLTRCKSEPMRSAAKLAPEACFWKNRKLEPHRPATLGVGAAGVGC